MIRTTVVVSVLLLLLASGSTDGGPVPGAPAFPNADQKRALEALASEIQGWLLYATAGSPDKDDSGWRVRKMRIGEWKPIDLGPGRYARWSADGTRIAVWRAQPGTSAEAQYAGPKGTLYVMDADGGNVRKVVDDVWGAGCPMDWMPDGKHIVFTRKVPGGHALAAKMMIVDVASGQVHDVAAASRANAEPQVSADGRYVAAREKYDPHKPLVVYDLKESKRIVYGNGCCAALSPSGEWGSNNFDGHNRITLHQINGSMKIHNAGQKWDNPHWSNHNDFIAAQGDACKGGWIFRISQRRWTQVLDGVVDYPDLYVTNADRLPDFRTPKLQEAADLSGAKTWPGSHKDLIFVCADGAQSNPVLDEAGRVVRECELDMQGSAFLTRGCAMGLLPPAEGQGGFVAKGKIGAVLAGACRKSGRLSVEMVLTAFDHRNTAPSRYPITGCIVEFGSDSARPNFRIQQDRVFQLVLRTSQSPDKPAVAEILQFGNDLPTGTPIHLIVSYEPGTIAVYVNGRLYSTGRSIQGDLSNWGDGRLIFGDSCDGRQQEVRTGGTGSWGGLIEGVAIYSRLIGPEEAARKFELYRGRLRERPAAEAFSVSARLVRASPVPDPRTLTDYPRALVVHEWQVTRAPKGSDLPGKNILVAHWAVLGGKVLPFVQAMKPGYQVERLWLEPFEANKQVHGEKRSEDLPPESLGLPLYLCVGTSVAPFVPADAATLGGASADAQAAGGAGKTR